MMPVQRYVWSSNCVPRGRSVIAIAPRGKTLCHLIPIVVALREQQADAIMVSKYLCFLKIFYVKICLYP